ncbi:hypothetical protein AMES_6322 [Amycolatopsis mediterranei S699]|uniref:Secreted protein n=2 Tax=Amycolatopsis mediterranei TaxID=33910 RepID=A0A0H3DD45_AMYMU|nr:hypothetical protein [Amycolatopsis mediterranei]ADJ48147.1 hypothetical protein AMED_6415 [Amycolatopsis mediterranei U32]AEK45050.1 hypothetical protein RAM_32885 [Amycolatopsis mediterranei S699]AFO79858.1 hypothetical protein AMES_6322 [Amycolatopsis mediterranei S699]AGT86986.1 hypothetical protein B737_6322 [Amycolatopsis mediterranei RB]KDO10632.1 hypothetical protein DV26_12135 [Amycolatopsis mediterranei]
MTMNRKPARIAVIVSSALALALGVLGGPSAAFAAPLPGTTHETQMGMHATGFDEAVAKAHGYRIVTYANGDQQSVPIDPQSKLPKSLIVHPQPAKSAAGPERQARPAAANTDYNEVWGNCGRSWIRVAQTGTDQVGIVSGFSNTPTIAYFWIWDVLLSDQNGTSHQTYDGAIFDDKATHVWLGLTQHGYTYDYVYNGGATLIDGTICVSGHPDVSIYL